MARLPSPLRALSPSGDPEVEAWTRIEHRTVAAGSVRGLPAMWQHVLDRVGGRPYPELE